MVVALVLSACGDEAAGSADAGPAASGDADAAPRDAAPVSRDAEPTVDAAPDAGPQPGDPASGDPELIIRAALDPDRLNAPAEVRHGDRLYWECAPPTQVAGAGHIWVSFRLESPAVEDLSPQEVDWVEEEFTAQLVEVIDGEVGVIADNAGSFDLLSKPSPRVLELAPLRMILEGDYVGETTKPSQIDESPAIYRVLVPLPGGRSFRREVEVDTEVPESELPKGC